MNSHLFENGKWLVLANVTIEGKVLTDFFGYNARHNAVCFNSEGDLKYSIVLDLLKTVIPEKVSKTQIMDVELTENEISGIKKVFEVEIVRLLAERKLAKTGYRINVFGEDILVDTRNQIEDMDLKAFNDIYLLSKECLDANKSVYLSID